MAYSQLRLHDSDGKTIVFVVLFTDGERFYNDVDYTDEDREDPFDDVDELEFFSDDD